MILEAGKERTGFPTRASIKGYNSTKTNFGPMSLLMVGLQSQERKQSHVALAIKLNADKITET